MVVKNYTDEFDPNYYMNKYPSIKNEYGSNSCDLLTHFQNYGVEEGRFLNYDVEKQSNLSNPTFSQNYIKFNGYDIDNSDSKLITTKNKSNNECRDYCNNLDDCAAYVRRPSNNKCFFYSGSVYPDSSLTKNSNRDTFIREKINNTVCDAECKRNKKLKTYEEKYKRSLYNLQTAPERVANAKKKYIILKDGEPYYQEMYKKELSIRIDNIIRDMLDENKKNNIELNNSLRDYEQKYLIYNSHLKNYLGNIETDNIEFEKELYDKITDKELDARKSYYETNETDTIKSYSYFFTVIYYLVFTIYFVLFIYNGLFLPRSYSQNNDKAVTFGKGGNNILNILYLIFLFFFPIIFFYFILKHIFMLVGFIYNHIPKNVYYDI